MRPLAHALGVADAVREGVREGVAQARRHPEWLAATAAAIFIVRPRRTWRWARRGLLLWSGIDFLRQPRPESAPAPAGRLARWLRLFLR